MDKISRDSGILMGFVMMDTSHFEVKLCGLEPRIHSVSSKRPDGQAVVSRRQRTSIRCLD